MTTTFACNRGGRDALVPVIAASLLTCLAAPSGTAEPFEAPWIGYNAGESAYPGNADAQERDPYAMAAADFDGDGAIDIALANYDYASPGGTSGQSGFAILFNSGDGSLAAPVHYTVSTKGHFDIVTADLDGDGDPDLALPHSGRIGSEVGNQVVVFHNDGSGVFALAGSFTVQQQPMTLATGDFNRDGKIDLVAGSSRFDSHFVSVILNTGNGLFASQQTVLAGDVPDKVAAGDFDGDGADDIAASALGNLVVIMNDGTGNFLAPEMLSDPSGIDPVVGVISVADLNGDGALDLLHGSYQGSGPHAEKDLAVRLGNGDGTFDEPVYYHLISYSTTPEAIVPVDLDGDGDLDVATCDWSARTGDGIAVIFNDGTGVLVDPRHVPAGQGTQDLVVADLDGDGDADIATADRMSLAVTVHDNPGDGRFPILATLYATDTSSTRHLAVADVDDDGDLDAFASGESFGTPGALMKNNGDGTFADPVVYTHSTEYGRGVSHAKLRDLDGDGDLDLLYNDAHTDFFTGYDFWVALNDGTGSFGVPVEWDQNTCGNGDIDAFDIDGDGDLDVINTEELGCAGVESANKLYININNGDATFQPPVIVQISTGPHDIDGGDFNEDGHVDLVTTHWMPYGGRDFINVHIGVGDGTFQEEVVYQVGAGPRYVLIADLDGDGHQDLATANSGADDAGRETLTVLFGTGTGAFVGRTDYYAPYSPDLLGVNGLTVGDLDGDADLDLIMATVANGAALYINDGAGAFSFSRRLGVYWNPASPVYADFDADEVPDLLTLVSNPPSGLPRSLALQKGFTGTTVGVGTDGAGSGAGSGQPVVGARLRAHPNPSSGPVQFVLSVEDAQHVAVSVFDPSGRRVAALHEGTLPAGNHVFALEGVGLTSGVYFVRADGETFAATRRVTLLR